MSERTNAPGPRFGFPRPPLPATLPGLALAALLSIGCGGRETGAVRFDPEPARSDGVHQVEYQAGCRSGAECIVTFSAPEGRGREIFGSQWSHRFFAVPGQQLYLGVTVRQRCSGNYALGRVRCDRAAGSARVAVFVDGERVASRVGHSRNRGVVPEYSFGVAVRHRISRDSASSESR